MIVVTGGGGFIGKTLIERLQERTNEEIINVDFRAHMGVKNIHPYEFLDKIRIRKFSNAVSMIFHNGACSATTNEDVHYMMKNNFDYSTVLLRRCMDNHVRIIYASSASIYGKAQGKPFSEGDVPRPKNIYGLTKSLFDQYVDPFLEYDSQIVGLRYFNVFGRNEEHKGDMASVVYKFFKQKSSGKIKLFEGSEKFRRDFVHVDDVVDVNLFFYENPQISGIYNVGTGVDRSFKEIANIFVDRYSVEIETMHMPEKLINRYQDYTCSDNTKLLSVYDKKFLSLEQGISRYIDYLESG